MDAAPSPKEGGTALLRYDCWNLCVRSFSPESPIRGGGGVGNRLEGLPGVAMDPGPRLLFLYHYHLLTPKREVQPTASPLTLWWLRFVSTKARNTTQHNTDTNAIGHPEPNRWTDAAGAALGTHSKVTRRLGVNRHPACCSGHTAEGATTTHLRNPRSGERPAVESLGEVYA